jgi:hypothetical protein
MMIVWPTKGPTEAYDFGFDFSGALATDEAIATKAVVGDGATIDSSAIVGSEVQVSLSGGVVGTVAKVTCTIVTNSVPPRTYSEVAVLAIGGEAISLATAKVAQRIDTDDEDALLSGLLRAAIGYVERATGKNLTAKIETQIGNGFPGGAYCSPSMVGNGLGRQAIRLWKGPASEILSIKYDDSDGAEQTLSSFRLVEGANAKLLPAFGASWPVTAIGSGTVRLTYIAGYDPAELPPELTHAALMLFGHWYANREAVIASDRAAAVELPLGVQALLEPYRAPGIA